MLAPAYSSCDTSLPASLVFSSYLACRWWLLSSSLLSTVFQCFWDQTSRIATTKVCHDLALAQIIGWFCSHGHNSKGMKERFFLWYAGFCKQQLWPMLHYWLPLSPNSASRFDPDLWQAYVKANKVCSYAACLLTGKIKHMLACDYQLYIVSSLQLLYLSRLATILVPPRQHWQQL